MQETSTASDSTRHLARHAAEIALTVNDELDGRDELPDTVLASLESLHTNVEAILQHLQRSTEKGRIAKVLHRTTISNEVKSLRADLQVALQEFRVSANMICALE